jgi:hypothetical protein
MQTLIIITSAISMNEHFKLKSWGGIRVKVPRPIEARFDGVCSDLSFFIHLNFFEHANSKRSKGGTEWEFGCHCE